MLQSGNEINSFGMSDIFLNASIKFNKLLSTNVGFKVPLSSANKSLNNLPLPMDY